MSNFDEKSQLRDALEVGFPPNMRAALAAGPSKAQRKPAMPIDNGTEMTGEEAYHKAAAEYEVEQIHKKKLGAAYPKFCYLSPQEQAYWVARIATKRGAE